MARVILACLLVVIGLVCTVAERSSRIKHIVVLMMENRSFDNLLGWLKQDKNPAIDGLTGKEALPRDINDPSLGTVPVTRNGYDKSPDDPKHGFDDIATQIHSDRMDGFVFDSRQYGQNETNPVSMFDLTSASSINTLATEFAVFDRWFCSIPTSTDPNRAFALSGTSMGVITNFNGTLWTQPSYFEYLRQHNRTFAGYYQDDVWVFGYFQDMHTPEVSAHIFPLESQFFSDVKEGKLADFVWLQPRSSAYGPDKQPTWQHPDASVKLGDQLIKDVYEALRSGPQWEETLFLITYDEHGGFYDHVTPPRNVPAPDSNVAPNGFAFDQLGVRIPTIAISPWIQKGRLVHDALPNDKQHNGKFESTSIMATANILLGLEHVKPLSQRMGWANTFATLVEELDAPRSDTPETLPPIDLSDVLTEASAAEQRAKPLNEHLEGQLIFFCAQHYAELHARGECPGRPSLLTTQGQASDWLALETKKYVERVRLGSARR